MNEELYAPGSTNPRLGRARVIETPDYRYTKITESAWFSSNVEVYGSDDGENWEFVQFA